MCQSGGLTVHLRSETAGRKELNRSQPWLGVDGTRPGLQPGSGIPSSAYVTALGIVRFFKNLGDLKTSSLFLRSEI